MFDFDDLDQSEHSEYDQLPECIKQLFPTPESYLWLPDDQKRTLIQDETEPEVE